ncbi:MAG TPA: DUF5947 family protein [Kofleriaceae bacterium]|nr:DUF5947 family protein [Kofleriaceae bacterium]
MIAFRSLARLAATDAITRADVRCELCGGPLTDTHRHVVELGQRGVQCVCHACGILFARGSSARFRTIPDRVRIASLFDLTPERWAELGIPVALAFCYRDSLRGCGVVCYPGPAGVTDAALEPAVWDAICDATPLAADLEADVEALIVRGGRGATTLRCYLVPISTAYELVGRLRRSWQGFSGGEEAEAELASFFAELERRGERP